MKGSMLSLIVLLISLSFNFLESQGCTQKLKRAKDLANFTISCYSKAGFSTVPTHEDMLKPDFDDKCAGKCIVGALELIDEAGRVDKDALSDFLQENVLDQTLLKVNEMATACVDSSGSDKVTGTKPGKTPEECKAVGKFHICFVTSADKLC